MITAVDVGATKTLIAQFNGAEQPMNEFRFPTPKEPADFISQLLQSLQRFSDISLIVIGVPGIADNGVVLRCGNLPWHNFQLRALLAKHYFCPILIENDADLAGLSEINALSPIPALGLYITISTGIGAGLIVDGKLMKGLHRTEPGHMRVYADGGWHIWQDVASGKTIKEHFGKMARDLTEPAQWQWVAERVSLGLQSLIPSLQPDVIVFGGGVGNYFEKFSPYLIERLRRQLPAYILLPHLRKAQHSEEAVLYGCYQRAIHYNAL